jgi:NAD(P)-dependent dehydrogenase (short-subunit alcohol dehydrogenase family)
LYVWWSGVIVGVMAGTVLVVGAQGVLGTFVSRALSEAGWEVVRVGRRPESDVLLLDLDDAAALSEACTQADLVVSTAHHPELAVERTVLRDGGLLIDLVELSKPERARLAGEEAGAPGLVVADTGLGGVAYLAVAELLREHPEADEADYSMMFSASGAAGRAGALFAHGLLAGASHHPTARLPLPEPYGDRRCIQVEADGTGVLRDVVSGVPLRHYLCMQPRVLASALVALNGVRLLSLLPVAAFTAGIDKAPTDPTGEPVCDWVAVSAGGRRLGVRTVEGRGVYGMTAAATVAFADALVRSPNGRRGLLSVDEVLTLDAVRPLLERHGITVG